MNLTESPARQKGVQSPLKGGQSPLKGVQSPLGPTNRSVRSPATPQSLRKKQHQEDGTRKLSLGGSAENCNPNSATVKSPNEHRKSPQGFQKLFNGCERNFEVSDGCEKSFNGQDKIAHGFQRPGEGSLRPSKMSESGTHACRSRRCGVNYSDWASGNLKPQPRKFLVAKRIEKPNQQEGSVCKCCQKKSKSGSADISTGRKCVCTPSQKLRASQEEFMKDNFSKTERCSAEIGETRVETQIDVQETMPQDHACGVSSVEDRKDGISGMRGNSEEAGVAELSGMNEKEVVVAEVSGMNEKEIRVAEVSGMNEKEIRVAEVSGMNEKIRASEFSELCNGNAFSNNNMRADATLSPRRGVSPAPRRPKNELLAEAIGSIPEQGGGRVKHLVKAFESLLSLPDYETSESPQTRPLDKSIYKVSDTDQGKCKPSVGKSLKWALPGMQPKGSEKRISGNSSPSHESCGHNYDDSYVDNERQMEFGMSKGLNWALAGLQAKGSEERSNSSNSPVHEYHDGWNRGNRGTTFSETSFADLKSSYGQPESVFLKRPYYCSQSNESSDEFKFFPVCEETASVSNKITRSINSIGRSQSGSGSRRRGRKESLDSTGRGSLSRSGIQQWKKQLKVTCAQPFKLRTEQRGHMKEKEFRKKVQVMLIKEEKSRIPMAQGLPWTTDEPEHLVKPPVKECTKPVDVKLYTEIRAIDRAEFDQIIADKLNALEQQRLEEERIQKLAEEEEIKRLRKEMIPRAQPMPFFDRPFIPRRSSKSPTIPKEPKFHIPHHKRAKCISWNDFNICQQ